MRVFQSKNSFAERDFDVLKHVLVMKMNNLCQMYRTNSCQWGDMCRHQHVLCRFDTKCTKRETCPFGHSNAGTLDPKSEFWMPKKTTTKNNNTNTTTATATTQNNVRGRMYAIDCEFIEIATPSPTTGDADLSTVRKCVVSVGIVDVELEIVLYARVRKPPRMIVVDDSFARTVGGLGSDWTKGVHVEVVRTLLNRFLTGGGVLVGWSLEHDLTALGLKCSTSQIVELTNVYQTESAKKCRLSEAYRSVFNRRSFVNVFPSRAIQNKPLKHRHSKCASRK